MRKIIILSSVFIFSLHFGQLSKVSEVNKAFDSRNKEISAKYLQEYPLERIREEEENNNKRLDGYEAAIANIQKKEKPYGPTETFDDVESQAEFDKGVDEFRKMIGENFDTSAITAGNGVLRTDLSFVIDETGKVSAVKAEGASREFNLLMILNVYQQEGKGKWKPAGKDGKPVKSRFRFPISMRFE